MQDTNTGPKTPITLILQKKGFFLLKWKFYKDKISFSFVTRQG